MYNMIIISLDNFRRLSIRLHYASDNPSQSSAALPLCSANANAISYASAFGEPKTSSSATATSSAPSASSAHDRHRRLIGDLLGQLSPALLQLVRSRASDGDESASSLAQALEHWHSEITASLAPSGVQAGSLLPAGGASAFASAFLGGASFPSAAATSASFSAMPQMEVLQTLEGVNAMGSSSYGDSPQAASASAAASGSAMSSLITRAESYMRLAQQALLEDAALRSHFGALCFVLSLSADTVYVLETRSCLLARVGSEKDAEELAADVTRWATTAAATAPSAFAAPDVSALASGGSSADAPVLVVVRTSCEALLSMFATGDAGSSPRSPLEVYLSGGLQVVRGELKAAFRIGELLKAVNSRFIASRASSSLPV